MGSDLYKAFLVINISITITLIYLFKIITFFLVKNRISLKYKISQFAIFKTNNLVNHVCITSITLFLLLIEVKVVFFLTLNFNLTLWLNKNYLLVYIFIIINVLKVSYDFYIKNIFNLVTSILNQ